MVVSPGRTRVHSGYDGNGICRLIRRYSLGATPILRRNCRAAKSGSPQPTDAATTEIGDSVTFSKCAIRSARSIVRYAIGDFPNACVKTRRNCDGDKWTAPASSGTDQRRSISLARSSAAIRASARNGRNARCLGVDGTIVLRCVDVTRSPVTARCGTMTSSTAESSACAR